MPVNVNGISLSSNGTALTMANGATNWMLVNSNGIISRPQTPIFQAILSGQGSFYTGNPVTFGSVQTNQGSCWNNSTGQFTCPVAGKYLVSMGAIGSGSANGVSSFGYYYIFKNGSTYHFSHWNTATYWEYGGVTGVVDCAIGDTISYAITGGGTNGVFGGGDHCNFSIALII